MIPAGYEKNRNITYAYSDEDEDDDDEFDFGGVTKIPIIPTEVSITNKLDQINNFSELNNNEYYDDHTELILNELKTAIFQKKLETVKSLLQTHDLDVNVILKNEWTPLMYASSCGSYELCEYLIENGADIFFSDDSFSIIHAAAGCCDLNVPESDLFKIIELIVSKGVDINQTDRFFQTPLMFACRAGNSNLIDSLIKLNADINAQDDADFTALSHACQKGHLRCVKILLKLNANTNVYTSDYNYPNDLAEQNGFYEISRLIKRYNKVKKLESKDFSLIDENEDDEEESENRYFQDIKNFLNGLKLKHLIPIFHENDIKMKKLLLITSEELINLGIDVETVDLIQNECKKFHLKNWKSSSLVPIRQEDFLDCNELTAIVSNLSRHSDYMSTNVQFLISTLNQCNQRKANVFKDQYLRGILMLETKQALINSKQLFQKMNQLSEFITKNVNPEDLNAKPTDYIEPTKKLSQKLPSIKTCLISTLFVCSLSAIVHYRFKN